jgi:hypothetical protein
MVAETGLKWQDDGETCSAPGLYYVQSLRSFGGSPFVFVSLRGAGTNHKMPPSLAGRRTRPRRPFSTRRSPAVNAGTSFRYEIATNGAEEYTLANLPPGTYRIEVEKSGFKKLVRPDVTLHVQDALAIDLEMAVGSVSETVRVEAGTVRDAGWLQPLIPSSSPVPMAIRHTDNESHGSRQFRSACGNPTSNSDKRST